LGRAQKVAKKSWWVELGKAAKKGGDRRGIFSRLGTGAIIMASALLAGAEV